MKTAYYLAHQTVLERFDALFAELDILATTVAIEKVPSLTAFIMKEKTLVQQNYIILDVSGQDWTTAHILSAVQQLRRFSSAQLIFLGQPSDATTELFGTLARVHHVEYLITEDPDSDITAQLRGCFQDAPYLPHKLKAIQKQMVQTAARTVSPLKLPDGMMIEVAVAGTMSRCGTTTQAFCLWHYLKSLGLRPAMMDKSGTTLSSIQMVFEKEIVIKENALEIRGIPFCETEDADHNAYILDYGRLTPENATHFGKADLSVLVGCTKPWELPAFADALRLVVSHPCRQMVTLASFSTQQDMEQLSKYFGSRNGLVPYHPNLWEPVSPQTYETLVLPALKEICGEPQEETECEFG